MTSNTEWLKDYRHPSSGEPFSLPDAIYFLIKFRADLAHFKYKSIKDRMVLYFWWNSVGKANYPDFEWVLRPLDVAYVRQLDTNTLITEYEECIAHWLRGTSPDVLEEGPLVQTLLENESFVGASDFEFPRFLDLIIRNRPDLHQHLTLDQFPGQLASLDWWEKHGQFEYPKVAWSPASIHASLNHLENRESYGAVCFPRFLPLILESRPDLKTNLDLSTLPGQLAAVTWWEKHGRKEYANLAWSTAQISNFLNQLDGIDGLVEQRFPRFLPLIIEHRPDLQKDLDLRTAHGQLAAAGWWEKHGKTEFPTLRWSTSSIVEYFNELDEALDGSLMKVPRFVAPLINSRPDLPASIDIATFAGQVNCLQWWQDSGKLEYPYLRWTTSSALEQLQRLSGSPSKGLIGLPQFLLWLRDSRPDLQAAFDISTNEGRRHLVRWWQDSGRNEYRVLSRLSVSVPSEDVSHEKEQCSVSISRLSRAHPVGVNIIGFPQGVLGLGEDARTAARALATAAMPSVLVNAPMIGPPKLDMSINHLLSEELKYDVSLFCLPPPEMVRLALEGGRKIIESDTYKIGAWPWELPQWPSAFGKVHTFVDELWAQSKFVQTALGRQAETPVHHMPMSVEIPAPVAAVRGRFGLPEGEFLFYLMFDGNSWLTRKNPVAGVRAFQEAFAKGQSGVGLVIKAMNIRDDDPIWREVAEIAAKDNRIHLISERLSRQDSIDFMACCDAYISLHRSEGFGRVIAEAMVIGQPVVVTNFSGNVDFCDANTSFLVDGELVPLRPGDYLFHEGQYWCDPDVSAAARQLVRIVDDAKERERIAAAGKLRIQTDYSIDAVGKAYAKRLTEIHSEGATR